MSTIFFSIFAPLKKEFVLIPVSLYCAKLSGTKATTSHGVLEACTLLNLGT